MGNQQAVYSTCAGGSKAKDSEDKVKEPKDCPLDVTCPHLPPRVVVFGYVQGTQCQMVNATGVGRMDLIERGFIDAVDVWSNVNGGIEVCFRNFRWLVFVDAAPPTDEGPAPLPVYESIPQSDCQIKLQETLFLRATPGGEIIGLVWLNSEVPVFETTGDWYRTEFQGQTGYISRFYRRVLSGGCAQVRRHTRFNCAPPG